MKNDAFPMIRITKKTKELLDALKKEGQSYNDVIWELLK